MWGNPTLFSQPKYIEKNIEKRSTLEKAKNKYWEKVNIDKINSKKLFVRSADHK